MLRLAVDAITGFSTAPLRFASHVGLWLVAASILLVGYIGGGFFTGSSVPGWTSLMLVVVILGAVQMFVLGMIGEYLGRVYVEAKRRPLYIVAEIAGQAGGRPQLGHVAQQAPVRALAESPREPTRSPPAKRRASSAAGRSRAAPGRKSSRTES
jgi:dolichol-phosphate mannosyltransferase